MNRGRVLATIAVIVFAIASFGAWPDALADDVDPVALGLALFAASFIIE